MEIKATLEKPYTENQKLNFIVQYNHNLGYEIEETDEELQAWGYTEEEETALRQANFEANFLATSLGNYRLVPQGYANAQNNLGGCYRNGFGVMQDYSEAVKWYKKAADQGVAEAQFNMGLCYNDGLGVVKNYSEAVKWFKKAAEQGMEKAQTMLKVLE